MTDRRVFRKKPLAAAISALTMPMLGAWSLPVFGENEVQIEEIVVTATRRSESVQDVPINISAVTGSEIQQQGLTNLAELSAWVPGLHIVDQGARGTGRIIARGLNADPLAGAEALVNDGGGMVATYLGDIPIYIDLQLNDIERVEVLLGPQGTLYGAGTMAGAIRYIPKRPKFDATEVEVRGSTYQYDNESALGGDGGATINLPISDTMAFRGSYDYRSDPGFIDYKYLVRDIGVSNPDPDFSNPADVAANLKTHDGANDVQTKSSRAALRWDPTDAIDATLTYYAQVQDAGARNISSHDAMGTGKYVSGLRVMEPNERDNQLLALEATADLGFAELTSATGFAQYHEHGHRDQTDLLITLEYSYEAFPNFTAYTKEKQLDQTFTQELRLVSNSTGKLSWIVGGFYKNFDSDGTSKEFTPGYDAFAVANFGGVQLRPDNLEYISKSKQKLKEYAGFGEIAYQLTEAWQVTLGMRWYKYEFDTRLATDTPLYNTVFGGAPQDEIDLEYGPADQSDDGVLYKFNTSYQITHDVMTYLTVSEGYRIGNSNGIALCPDPLPPGQNICAQPDELEYKSDTTTNYEIGAHTSWLDGRLTVNGDVFYIDWQDPQVLSATQIGLQPITKNGKGAESKGMELSINWLANENWVVRGSYSYAKAELTDEVANLIGTINPPGFQNTITYLPGEDGDRLPGSPENQGSLFVSYTHPLPDGYMLDIDYGVVAISNVETRTGNKGYGEHLSGYAIQDLSAGVSRDQWTVTAFAKNLFDQYAETSASQTRAYIQTVPDINGDPVIVRSYRHDVLPPRMVGLRFTWQMAH
jgi:iron complex outermembrane receptor protein